MRNLVPERILNNLKNKNFKDRFVCFSMFVDISGFTKTTEALMKHGQEGAEVLSDILRYLFDTTVKAVYEHGGYVTKYAGDAFTALFEPGKDLRQTAINVLNAAMITNRFFRENKIFRSKFGDFEFGVKVGIGFGECVCGVVGGDKEKTYYFSGSAVDLCAMAEHNAEKGDIWASESAFSYIEDVIPQRKLSEMYGAKFFKIVKADKFSASVRSYKPVVYDKELLYTMTGRYEADFPVGEFRDVISVFISFEGDGVLERLMQKIYELKESYGASHPVLDFGDKGGNILLFYGAPISFENNSFRALSFISGLMTWADSISIRAGLAKGVVYCGFNGSELRNEFTCLGNTVNQSARFMMKAEWGQVLVDKELSSNEHFVTDLLGDIQYKGREGLIPTYVLKGKTEIKDIFFKGSFFGRIKETAKLRKYLEPMERSRNCGIIYVDGEAGIGKSRFTNQMRREYENEKYAGDTKWFYFVCDDIIREPYNPFRYFFNRYFDFEEDSVEKNTEKFNRKFKGMLDRIISKGHRESLAGKRDYLAYFLKLDINDATVLTEEPNERQNSIVLALIDFFKIFTEKSSLIFEIDNGSSIDMDSLKLFQRIYVSLKRSSFAILFNCRLKDNGDVYDHGFTKQRRIRLKNLTRPEFKDLVKERFAINAVPKETLSVLEEKSKLNPLFLEQLIFYIKENHLLDKKNRITNVSDLPSGINQIILARIDKLNTDLKEIIKTASCIGNEIAVDLISYLFRNTYSNISAYLSELEKEDIFILFSEMSYLFKYGVIRDVVYNIQLKKVLRELHGEIGKAVEYMHKANIENYYSILAYHFEKAENTEKALYYHEKAGYQAKENYLNDQALYHFDRAACLISVKNGITEDKWVDKYHSLDKKQVKYFIDLNIERFHCYYAFSQNIKLSSVIMEIMYKLSTNLGDGYYISHSLINRSQIYANKGEFKKSNSDLNAAIKIQKKLGLYYFAATSYISLGKNHMMVGDMKKASEYLNFGLEQAGLIENEKQKNKIKAKIYGDMGIVYDYSGDMHKALECYNKQLEITERLNLKIEKATALGNIGVVYHMTGDLNKAREYYLMRLKLSEELGRKADMTHILNNMGFLYKDLKNYKKAVIFHKKSIHLSREISDHNTEAEASVNLGHVYKLKIEYDKAEQSYLNGIKIAENYGYRHIYAEGMIELADLYSHQKKIELSKKYVEIGLQTAQEIKFTEYVNRGMQIFDEINSK